MEQEVEYSNVDNLTLRNEQQTRDRDIMERITNREDLKDYIHDIHNFLRNSGAAYGMNALKMFNLFYGLYRVEKYRIFDKFDLSEKCVFSTLKNISDKEEQNFVIVDILNELYQNKKTCDLLFHMIPTDLRVDVYSTLIDMISNISVIEEESNYQLSGKLYQYFIGIDRTAISELGAYFTDRHIVNYIYNKIDIELTETGNIPTMVDPFGGSGGFTIGYCNYLIEKYGNTIDWTNEINNIYHYDMNRDVVSSAALEIMCLTKNIPNMETNFKIRNSFVNIPEDLHFKLVGTNPPYGGDNLTKTFKITKHEELLKHVQNELKNIENIITDRFENLSSDEKEELLIEKDSIEHQITDVSRILTDLNNDSDRMRVQYETCPGRIANFARRHGIESNLNDKEACSMVLMMDLLDTDGICFGVVKEGFFFNNKYSEIRRVLIENYDVTDIISIPDDEFENTTTKTSIIIFKNTEKKTSEIRFFDMVIEKETETVFERDTHGKYFMSKYKGDISSVCDQLICTVPISNIRRNKYSLNMSKYNNMNIIPNIGFKMIKLKDIVNFEKKSKRPASFASDTGEFNFYTSSDKKLKCDTADFNSDEYKIIIGTGGKGSIHIDNIFTCSSDNFVISSNSVSTIYIYSYLLTNMHLIQDLMNGSTKLKHLSKESLQKFQIMICEDSERQQYWNQTLTELFFNLNDSKKRFEHLENEISLRIKDIIENSPCDYIELKKLCEIQYGTRIVRKNTVEGQYDVYGGGDKVFTTNTYNRDGFNILISRFGISNECIRIKYDKFYLNDSGMTLQNKTDNITLFKLIGFYLLTQTNYLYSVAQGSCQKNMTIDLLMKIKIPVPRAEFLESLSELFEETERTYFQIKENEQRYKEIIEQLRNEAIREVVYGSVETNNDDDEEPGAAMSAADREIRQTNRRETRGAGAVEINISDSTSVSTQNTPSSRKSKSTTSSNSRNKKSPNASLPACGFLMNKKDEHGKKIQCPCPNPATQPNGRCGIHKNK